MKRYTLGVWCSNNGDGSASAVFEQNRATAEQKCDQQAENGDGWGENSASEVTLVVKDDGLYFEKSDWDDNGKFVRNLVKLDEIPEPKKKKK